jgi:hypothetical protein
MPLTVADASHRRSSRKNGGQPAAYASPRKNGERERTAFASCRPRHRGNTRNVRNLTTVKSDRRTCDNHAA